jgi:hypothetical protein
MDCKVNPSQDEQPVRKNRDRGGLIAKTTVRNGKAFRAVRSSAFLPRIGGTGIVVAQSWAGPKVSVHWDVRQGRYDDFLRTPTRENFERLIKGKLHIELDHWPRRAELAALGLQVLLQVRGARARRRVPDLGPLYW